MDKYCEEFNYELNKFVDERDVDKSIEDLKKTYVGKIESVRSKYFK
jgi:hypothetical protein